VLRTICTTFSINEQTKMWGTAAHCVLKERRRRGDREANEVFIGGLPTTPMLVDPLLDIAVVKAEVSAPAIPFGTRPAIGDAVRVYGYMWGAFSPTIFFGRVANLNVEAGDAHYMIFDMRVGPGHSGSPIIDANGHVVSVMQVSAGGFSGGALYGYLDEMLPFWQN
jgi:V8-like Glu-specific endopeptidase